MTDRLRTVAAVLAGGVGTRAGLGAPKQLAMLGGRTMLEHSIAAFNAHPAVDEVIVLMPGEHVSAGLSLVDAGGFSKVSQVVEGGVARSDTSVRALELIGAEECNVLLHDAARPLVSAAIISSCVDALQTEVAVMAAIPSTDTVVEVEADTVRQVPDRGRVWRAQTPQGFRLSVIREAYAAAARDPAFVATDDCGVVLRYSPGVRVRVVPGEERNLKVTVASDFVLAEALLKESSDHE